MATDPFSFEDALGPTAEKKPIFVPADRTSKRKIATEDETPVTSDKRGELPNDRNILDAIKAAAQEFNVPPEYGLALAQQESGYRLDAHNDEYGADGPFQFIPSTAQAHGLRYGVDTRDINLAARAAMKDFSEQMAQGGVEWAIKHHFAGPNVKGHGPKTRQYLADVTQRANDIRTMLDSDTGIIPSDESAAAKTGVGGSSDAGPKQTVPFSFEDALGAGAVPATEPKPAPKEEGIAEQAMSFLGASAGYAAKAAGRGFDYIKNRLMTDFGQISADDPRYTPGKGVDDPFAETRDTRKRIERAQKEAADRGKPPSQGFWANLENPMKLFTEDSLPANFLEAAAGAKESERNALLAARKVAMQENIVANPHKYPAIAVESAKQAIALREQKQEPGVREIWNDLKGAATADPGRFGAQFVNAVMADPEMLLAPQGIGLRVVSGTKAAVTGAEAVGRIAKTADKIIDAGTTSAALNLGIEATSAASEGRSLTPGEAGFAAATGAVAGGLLGGIFSKGSAARAKIAKGQVTAETLESIMKDIAQEDLAVEQIVRNPIDATTKHRIEEAVGIKFEAEADVKRYLETTRKEWKKLFEERDLNGQYQKALAEERISRAETLASEAADRKVAAEREASVAADVEAAYGKLQEERTASFAGDYEKALAARNAAEEADVQGAAMAENDLRAATDKLDQQDIFEAAFDGDVPAIKRAMNNAARRDSQLARPKWQRGEVDPRLVIRLGIGSLFSGAAFMAAPEENKLQAAFAGGLAGLMLPGVGGNVRSVGKKLSQMGAVSPEGDVIGLLVKQGKLQVAKSADEALEAERELLSLANKGDQKAYKALYEENYPRIKRYVRKFLRDAGPRLGLDADDIAQETFVKAFKNLEKFQGNSQFYTWLHSIARNEGLMAIREAQTLRGGREFEFQSAELPDARTAHGEVYNKDLFEEGIGTAPDDTPEMQAVRQEVEQQLIRAVEKLPENQRDAFLLNRVEQYTAQEIADMKGENLSTILMRIKSADDKVTKALAKEFGAKSTPTDTFLTGSKAPKVMYHGGEAGITKFRGGSFFTPDESGAKFYAQEREGSVYPVEVNIKNPATGDVVEAAAKKLGLKESMFDSPWQYLSRSMYSKDVDRVITELKKQGYDGAYFDTDGNPATADTMDSWFPFDSNQIRIKGPKGPKSQRGEIDPRLLRAGGAATLGAAAGAYLNDENKLLGAGLGALAGGILLTHGKKGTSVAKQIIENTDYALGITSTRIMNKSKPLWRKAIEHERVVLRDTHKYMKQVDPFLVKLQKLPKETRDILARSVLTGKAEVTNRLLQAIGDQDLISGWKTVRSTLDSLRDQLVSLKRFSKGELDYFPRVVKDVDGLLKALGKQRGSYLEETLKEAEAKSLKSRGTGLTELEKSLIINRTLAQDVKASQQPGFAKERAVEEITPELQQFYATPTESLHSYIRGAVEDIERAKFFGKDLEIVKKGNKEYTNVDTSIGNLVQRQMNEGKLTGKDAEEVASLLKSRFMNGERAPIELIQAAKNLSYSGLLGNPFSAATQLGDVIIQAYTQDIRSAIGATVRSLTGRKIVNMKDFGLSDHIAEEFVSTSKTAKMLNKIFKYSLFKGVDEFGKDVALNAAILRFGRLAKTEGGITKIASRYQDSLGPTEFQQLIKDLQKGEPTDLVRSIAFAELSRTQPVTRLELPQAYLDNPNGRLLYQYKTFMLKQIDVARRDAFNEIKSGNIAKGIKNLTELGIVMGVAGTTTNEIKNFMLGKEIDLELSDIPMNMLKTFGMSEYVIDHALGVSKEEAKERRKEGEKGARPIPPEPVKTILGTFAPPAKMFDEILRADKKAVRYLPFIGPFLYEQQQAAKEKK